MNHPLNILLIDDDDDTQNIFRMAAEYYDHHLLIASDGQEALAILQANKPDVIVIDLVLPGLDGYQVFDRIIDNELAPNSAIVAITAYHTSDTHDAVMARGFNGFLPKPLRSSELMQKLETIAEDR